MFCEREEHAAQSRTYCKQCVMAGLGMMRVCDLRCVMPTGLDHPTYSIGGAFSSSSRLSCASLTLSFSSIIGAASCTVGCLIQVYARIETGQLNRSARPHCEFNVFLSFLCSRVHCHVFINPDHRRRVFANKSHRLSLSLSSLPSPPLSSSFWR
jgi:hypothetical protein